MFNHLGIIAITCVLLICVSISGCNEQLLKEGSACQQLGLAGICTKVKYCTIALEAIKKKGYHELKRCGFNGTQEIVCCPNLSSKETTPVSCKGGHGEIKEKRKSKKMCENIKKQKKPGIDFIILGENASEGMFPHVVALGFQNNDDQIEWNCGASLISTRFLLTAAHCFICNGCSDPKKARLGVIDITDSESAQDIDVKKAISHPDYHPTSKHNDIGIIELIKDVQMSTNIYPACLYTEADDPFELQIVGWGQTENNNAISKSKFLQYGVINAVPINECNHTVVSMTRYSTRVILQSQVCAISKSDACKGDSGGPLQIKEKSGAYAIVGVVSYGFQCGTKVPGIYTRVASYLDWIEQNVWSD